MITKSTTPLTNAERLAQWIIKRGDTPLFFKSFKKPVRPLSEPKYRTLSNGMIKNTITGDVLEPTTHYMGDWWK